MSKKNLRKCIGCLELKNRDQMIKITREHKSGEIFINPNSKIFGRSAYLCYNDLCIENSLKKNRLAKGLKIKSAKEFAKTLLTFHKD